MSGQSASILYYLGEGGVLSQKIDSFQPRDVQIEIAEYIQLCMDAHTVAFIEAGTGAGKTFAYLIPALLSGRRVVISTISKNLQDQLFYKDIPTIVSMLPFALTYVLLKGRENYLCRSRFDALCEHPDILSSAEKKDFSSLKFWGIKTKTGDFSEMPSLETGEQLLTKVIATRDQCTGGECANFDRCYFFKSRRKATTANVLIINHALLFADISYNQETQFLRDDDILIFDEAHHLPDISRQYFGHKVHSYEFLQLIKEIYRDFRQILPDVPIVLQSLDSLTELILRWRQLVPYQNRIIKEKELVQIGGLVALLSHMVDQLDMVVSGMRAHMERDNGIASMINRLLECQENLSFFLKKEENWFMWAQVYTAHIELNSAPIDVGPLFSKFIQKYHCFFLFVSSTLTVNQDFVGFVEELGLLEHLTSHNAHSWLSPFNYAEQALLYIPKHLPEPRDVMHIEQFMDVMSELISISEGGALLLFTTVRAMHKAYDILLHKSEILGWNYPILLSSHAGREALIQRFRQEKNSILLGCQSLWEGIDVPGSSLRLLAIDKIPFIPPDDPFLEASTALLRQKNKNAFYYLQLRPAIISLKQGMGRLIRGMDDKGVLVMGDVRLLKKSYGATILRDMPMVGYTSDQDVVQDFLYYVSHYYQVSEEKKFLSHS